MNNTAAPPGPGPYEEYREDPMDVRNVAAVLAVAAVTSLLLLRATVMPDSEFVICVVLLVAVLFAVGRSDFFGGPAFGTWTRVCQIGPHFINLQFKLASFAALAIESIASIASIVRAAAGRRSLMQSMNSIHEGWVEFIKRVEIPLRNIVVRLLKEAREHFSSPTYGGGGTTDAAANAADAANAANADQTLSNAVRSKWFVGVDRIINLLHKDTAKDRPPTIKQVEINDEYFVPAIKDENALKALKMEYKKISLWWCLIRHLCPDVYNDLMARLGAGPVQYSKEEEDEDGGGGGG